MKLILFYFKNYLMKTKKRSKPYWQIRTAKERINALFQTAEKLSRENPDYSKRYVEMAMKICMRYNLGIPREYKRRFCRKCYIFFVYGVNCTVRISSRQKSVIIRCGNCGHIMRYPYRKEKLKNPS